jgi:hypothetical protein
MGAISSVLGYNVTAAKVAGMNATVGVRMEALESLWLQEEMYQVCRIHFTLSALVPSSFSMERENNLSNVEMKPVWLCNLYQRRPLARSKCRIL